MDAIKIYSSIHSEEIDPLIKKIPLKKNINVEYTNYSDRSIYSFLLKNDKAREEIAFYNVLAGLVYEIMIKFHAMDLVKEHVHQLLKDIGKIEKNEIVEDVYVLLMDKQYFIREKEKIKDEILDFLFENNILIVDGYIQFRNKELYNLIEKALERVMGDIQLEMEYSEFISVLKHFLDNQPAKIDFINLIMEEKDFQLLDINNKKVERDSISQVLEDIYSDDLTQGDILITTLINLAPKKILLHNKNCKDDKLLLVIEKVFEDRIETCLGCNKCKINKYEDGKDIKS